MRQRRSGSQFLPVAISLIHEPETPFGRAAYLAAMLTIFIHPGRRFGQLVEALILGLTGGLLGAAWALLGIHLGSLVLDENPSATFAIRGVFFYSAVIPWVPSLSYAKALQPGSYARYTMHHRAHYYGTSCNTCICYFTDLPVVNGRSSNVSCQYLCIS